MTDFEKRDRQRRENYTSGLRMSTDAIPLTNTRAERARRLGISVNTLDNWRKGTAYPTEFHLHKLSSASGWPVDNIREGRIPTAEEMV